MVHKNTNTIDPGIAPNDLALSDATSNAINSFSSLPLHFADPNPFQVLQDDDDTHLGPSLPPHSPSGGEGEERGLFAFGCGNHHGPSLPLHLPSGGEVEEGGRVALGPEMG